MEWSYTMFFCIHIQNKNDVLVKYSQVQIGSRKRTYPGVYMQNPYAYTHMPLDMRICMSNTSRIT